MRKEVDSAVQFICGLLTARSLSLDLVETFRTVLCDVMYGRYNGHWFPDKPCKGSAYRCMRINDRNIDPLILKAAADTGLTIPQLLQLLPNQLTVWVDPEEVAYRIGEDGSIGVLYSLKSAMAAVTSHSDGELSDSMSCESGSSKSSPSQSPVPCSTDDDSSGLPSLSVYGLSSCRQEMQLKENLFKKQTVNKGTKTGSSVSNTGSRSVPDGQNVSGQYLKSVLTAAS